MQVSVFALCNDHCSFMAFLWLFFRFQDCYRDPVTLFPQGVNRYLFVVSSLKAEKNASYFLGCFVVLVGEGLTRQNRVVSSMCWSNCFIVTAIN